MILHSLCRAFAALSLALTLLASPAFAVETDTLNIVDPGRGFSRVWRAYPDMDEPFVRDGTHLSLNQVRGVAQGQSKGQLVRQVGKPVSKTTQGAWNFNLSLPLPQGNRLVCQYRVYFDDAERVTGTVWRRPQCAGLVTGQIK